jgi:threonine/homoserine/homoserine lactone efflux protein
VVGGLAAIIEMAAQALTWIRWVGVARLVYLGNRTWREPPSKLG